jgi:CheY-like chemotaxis protein
LPNYIKLASEEKSMLSTLDAREENNARNGFNVSVGGKDAPKHILIADDEEPNRLVIVSILRSMGYHPEVARNGKEAVHKWEIGNFDLILMDINMPLVDGIEATWIIRNHEKDNGDHTPIIAYTADASKEDPSVFSSLGFDGFVRKPLDLKTLTGEIQRCIQLKRLGAAVSGHTRERGDFECPACLQ